MLMPQAVYKDPTPKVPPVATHPRILITAADLPRLQSWATTSNPVYQSGLLVATLNARM